MNNILATTDEDNVMIFTNLSAKTIEAALRERMPKVIDVVEVPDDDILHYVFDPLWLSREDEQRLKEEYEPNTAQAVDCTD